jgi:hypothetical protein
MNSYRFFETMTLARIPVLIADRCVLPRQDVIDYSKCSLRFGEKEDIGTLIKEWLSNHSDNEILEMGKYGQEMYKKYLRRDDNIQIMAEMVEKKIKEDV